MLAATHLTLKRHFNMDELFQHLVSAAGNRGKTKVGCQIPLSLRLELRDGTDCPPLRRT